MSENSNTGFWFGFILGMQLILIVLKLKGLISLTWLLVFTPMLIIGYVYGGLYLILLIIMLILSVANYCQNREFYKLRKKLKSEWKKLHKSGQV